jgi:hypothetical protein
MATAKKKKATTAAKRTVKSVAKTANEWTQQSAKLYQLPSHGDVSEVTRQAAAAAQSATENFFRLGSDAWQQWFAAAQSAGANPQAYAEKAQAQVNDVFGFNGLPAFGNLAGFNAIPSIPGFDTNATQAQLANFTRESTEQLNKTAADANRAMAEAMEVSRGNAEAIVEVSNIAVSLSKELSAELISYVNRNFSQNVELSKQVLACRTLNDMFDLGSRIMKTNLDGFFNESVKLSELLFQASNEVSEPLNERITESTDRLSKALAA